MPTLNLSVIPSQGDHVNEHQYFTVRANAVNDLPTDQCDEAFTMQDVEMELVSYTGTLRPDAGAGDDPDPLRMQTYSRSGFDAAGGGEDPSQSLPRIIKLKNDMAPADRWIEHFSFKADPDGSADGPSLDEYYQEVTVRFRYTMGKCISDLNGCVQIGCPGKVCEVTEKITVRIVSD